MLNNHHILPHLHHHCLELLGIWGKFLQGHLAPARGTFQQCDYCHLVKVFINLKIDCSVTIVVGDKIKEIADWLCHYYHLVKVLQDRHQLALLWDHHLGKVLKNWQIDCQPSQLFDREIYNGSSSMENCFQHFFAHDCRFILTFLNIQWMLGMLMVLGCHPVNIDGGYWWF